MRIVHPDKRGDLFAISSPLFRYSLGETPDGQQFFAMEYVERETVRRSLAGLLTLRATLDIAIQIASALTAAHAAGVVHRDLKPENVMRRRDGFVKVLDFGLAELTAALDAAGPSTHTAFRTDQGRVVGTVDYMSPEQARGQFVDARTDVYTHNNCVSPRRVDAGGPCRHRSRARQ